MSPEFRAWVADLQDRAFGALLGSLYACLVDGGRLIVGNVAADNPDRWAMEYFGEWFLLHRAPATRLEQAAGLQPPPQTREVGHEPTGVNLFLTVTR